jgi:O-antigen/teichoic acid export membrane protein
VTVIAGGTAIAQVMVALASPALTRLYTPSELGILSVYASLLATIVPVMSLRYEMAIPLPEEDDDAANILAVALGCVVGLAALGFILVHLFDRQIASAAHAAMLAKYLWLLPLGLLAAGAYQALSYWSVRQGSFGMIGRARVAQSIGQLSIQLGLGAAGAGAIGLLVGDVSGRATGAGSFTYSMRRKKLTDSVHLSARHMRALASRYRRFPLFGSWSALANAAGLHLTPFLIAATFGPTQAGWFTVGQRVMALPSTVIGQAVSQVYMHEAAILFRTDRRKLRDLYVRTAGKLFLLGLVLLGPAALLAPIVFPAVLGPAWHQTGVYMQVAAVMFFAQFIVSPLSQTLNVAGRQDLQLFWDVIRLGAMLGIFALAGAQHWGDVATIGVLAIVNACMYGVLAVLTWKIAGQSRETG